MTCPLSEGSCKAADCPEHGIFPRAPAKLDDSVQRRPSRLNIAEAKAKCDAATPPPHAREIMEAQAARSAAFAESERMKEPCFRSCVTLRAERDEARAQLAEVTRERDALAIETGRLAADTSDASKVIASLAAERDVSRAKVATFEQCLADKRKPLPSWREMLEAADIRVGELKSTIATLTAENAQLARDVDRLASRECHHGMEES